MAMAMSTTVARPGVEAPGSSTRRFAVLGAGFAGVSVAWHLLQFTNRLSPVCVEVFDGVGLGAGASGASGGLLHPFSPKGRLLWRGAEGWSAALELLDIAEQHVADQEPIAWKRGILRPVLEDKQANAFRKRCEAYSWNCLSSEEAKVVLPGLSLPSEGIAVHIPEGINIVPKRYLEALWRACQSFAKDAESRGIVGTRAVLHRHHVTGLQELAGGYEGVVVCLGAHALLLPELQSKLPVSIWRGVVADFRLPFEFSEQYCECSPSVLGTPWLALHGQRKLVLGATKEWVPPASIAPPPAAHEPAPLALKQLLHKAEQIYPGIKHWEPVGFRAGMRAVPTRTDLGTLPLVGQIDDVVQVKTAKTPYFWLLGGLGSRGLIYHAWLGKKVARAVIHGQEGLLPREFCRWKQVQGSEAQYSGCSDPGWA